MKNEMRHKMKEQLNIKLCQKKNLFWKHPMKPSTRDYNVTKKILSLLKYQLKRTLWQKQFLAMLLFSILKIKSRRLPNWFWNNWFTAISFRLCEGWWWSRKCVNWIRVSNFGIVVAIYKDRNYPKCQELSVLLESRYMVEVLQ